MINNLHIIAPLLKFESDDDFFFVQLLKRKKEHPELGSNSYCVKTYYIRSIEPLEKDYPEMKCLADFHNARVCINLNKRSFEKVAFQTMRKVVDQIMNKDYSSVRKSYNSVCGTYGADSDKSWIIDIDDHNFDGNTLIEFINGLQPIGTKLKAIIPTKNGYHLITCPFNLQEFKMKYPEIDCHKDNPSILYIS